MLNIKYDLIEKPFVFNPEADMEELFFDYTAKEKRQIRRMRTAELRSGRTAGILSCKRTLVIVILAAIVFFFTTFFFVKIISANATQLKTNARGFVSYEIKAGDTVWDIAKKYMSDDYSNVSELVKAIEKTNNIHNGKIYAGNYIVIPVALDPESQAK